MLVPGQYVRCRAAAPHYREFHNLGSANWRRGNDEKEPTLGEPFNQRQSWTRSEPLPVFPLPILIGDRTCIADGDTFASRVASSAVFNGFLVRCWRAFNPAEPSQLSDIPLSQRSSLSAQAKILNLLYSDPPAAAAAAVAFLGPGTVTTVDGNGLTSASPVTLIATNGPVTIVFITGTTNYQQIALQGMFSLIPPSLQAGFGTSAVWQGGMHVVDGRIIAAGIPATSEIRFVGHSYGGAIAVLLAAQYKRFSPLRPVELLTFGSPKPGDQRLSNLLVNVPSMNIVNVNDPIPSMPPSFPWLLPFLPTIETSILEGWAEYRPPPNQFILDEEGNLTPSNDATFSILQLGLLVADAIVSTPPAAIDAHSMNTYWTNIILP